MTIDWPGIRAAAVAIGVREAARCAGADLPEHELVRFVERVMKRCTREKWLVKAEAFANHAVTTQNGHLSAPVRNGADSVADSLADDSKATRLGFSRAARKVAEALPKKSQSALLDRDTAQSAKHWASVASIAQPGWEQEKKSDGGLVSVALIRLELPANMRELPPAQDPAERAKIADAEIVE